VWALAILAVAALVLDVIVHVATLAGLNVQDWVQPDWLARAVFFGLFLTVLLAANIAGGPT
jgi:hypothetical protein